MYEMKQLSQRKISQQEAAAYFDTVFNNTNLTMAEQDESIIQFYLKAASMNKNLTLNLNKWSSDVEGYGNV